MQNLLQSDKAPITILMEGLDRVGKDTQIKQLKAYYEDRIFHTFHYSSIPFKDNLYNKIYSEALYTDMFKMIKENKSSYHNFGIKSNRNYIFNRSHLGEYVYAPKYRNYSGEYIFDIEKEYKVQEIPNLFLIVMVSDPEKLAAKSDGLSLSDKVEDIKYELDTFYEAFHKSNIQDKLFLNVDGLDIPTVTNLITSYINSNLKS